MPAGTASATPISAESPSPPQPPRFAFKVMTQPTRPQMIPIGSPKLSPSPPWIAGSSASTMIPLRAMRRMQSVNSDGMSILVTNATANSSSRNTAMSSRGMPISRTDSRAHASASRRGPAPGAEAVSAAPAPGSDTRRSQRLDLARHREPELGVARIGRKHGRDAAAVDDGDAIAQRAQLG